jgi:hypothetical protein
MASAPAWRYAPARFSASPMLRPEIKASVRATEKRQSLIVASKTRLNVNLG